MRRLTLAIIVLFAATSFAVAQSDAHFSLFHLNSLSYNPGYAGSNDAICITSLHRQQWLGVVGRPVTTVFSGDMPLSNISSGVGFTLQQEVIGSNKFLSVGGVYSYRLDLGSSGSLGLGINLAVLNQAIDGDWVTPDQLNGGTTVFSDPLVMHADSKMAFDMGLGVHYRYANFHVGLSAMHLTQPEFKFNAAKGTNPYVPRSYYLVGGAAFAMPSPDWEVLPALMMQTDAKTIDMSLNARVRYRQKFWAGVTYRYQDAIVPMVGVHLQNGIIVAYSYDLPFISEVKNNKGSHEIVLSYSFRVNNRRGPSRHGTVIRL